MVKTQDRPIDVAEAEALTTHFRMLGDATRVRMLYALLEAGELSVGELAATVRAPDTSVSHALRLLRMAGIVTSRRDGRLIYYSLSDAHIRLLLEVSREHIRHEVR